MSMSHLLICRGVLSTAVTLHGAILGCHGKIHYLEKGLPELLYPRAQILEVLSPDMHPWKVQLLYRRTCTLFSCEIGVASLLVFATEVALHSNFAIEVTSNLTCRSEVARFRAANSKLHRFGILRQYCCHKVT